MLRFLFPRLTAVPARGQQLFDAVIAEARAQHWYVQGGAPDSLDGRFAMLSTITALVLVRLDEEGDSAASVALTERFAEAMKSEHREMGLGDPKLGRTVLELVGALERRVGLWRDSVRSDDWTDAVRTSVYRNVRTAPAALEHTTGELKQLRARLQNISAGEVADGRLG